MPWFEKLRLHKAVEQWVPYSVIVYLLIYKCRIDWSWSKS